MRSSLVRTISLLCAILVSLALSTPFARSQSPVLAPEDLTRGSDVIAVGRVKKLQSEWAAGKHAIVTRVTVNVDEILKGPGESTVTFLVPGGEVDGVGEWYSHTARFMMDEDIVLFAKRQNSGELRVTGGDQGKIPITKDPQTGARKVPGGLALEQFKARIANTR